MYKLIYTSLFFLKKFNQKMISRKFLFPFCLKIEINFLAMFHFLVPNFFKNTFFKYKEKMIFFKNS